MRNLREQEGEMSKAEQSKALYDEINSTLKRFGEEFDLSLLDAIGVLEIIKFEIISGNVRQQVPEPKPRRSREDDDIS